MKLALLQFNPRVGDLEGNADRILDHARQASAAGASLLLTTELALCGYPPEDLALRADFHDESARVLADLAARAPTGLTRVVGVPLQDGARRHNAAAVRGDGRLIAS